MKKIDAMIDRIKTLYGAKTRLELCEKMNISVSTYDTWVTRDSIPDRRLRQIAQEKEVHIEWLMTGSEPKHTAREPMFFAGKIAEAFTQNNRDILNDARCMKICKALAIVDAEKQPAAIAEILSVITKYY